MPDVCTLGHDAQGLAFAAAADQHRDVTGGRWVQDGQAADDQRQVAVKGIESTARGTELVAVLVVVLLEPARADTQDQPPLADVVYRACHVRQQLRVAVGVAGDQGADLDALGGLCEGTQRRPAFEVLALGLAIERVKVIPGEDHVGAQLLGLGACAPQVAVFRVLGLQLHAHSGWTGVGRGHGRTSWRFPITVIPESVTVKPRARSSSRLTPILTPAGTMTFLSIMARWIVAFWPTWTKSSRTLSETVA